MSNDVLRNIVAAKIVAVVRESNPDNVLPLCSALIDGGIRSIEITLTTPDSIELIETLRREAKCVVGAGSLISEDDFDRVASAGAQFYASPICNPTIVSLAKQNNIVSMPGALTPNEIWSTARLNPDLIKLFPLPSNGAGYIRSILAPIPSLRLAPSGGINNQNAKEILTAGATILNVGTWLMPGDPSLTVRMERSTARARAVVDAVTSE